MHKILTAVFGAGLLGWGFTFYQSFFNRAIVAFGAVESQTASAGDWAWQIGMGALLLFGLITSGYRVARERRETRRRQRSERAYSN